MKLKTRRHRSSKTCHNGARVTEVEEPVWTRKSVLFEFEVDEVAEPKALGPKDLLQLILKYRSSKKVAVAIGASEAFVRQNIKTCKLYPIGYNRN